MPTQDVGFIDRVVEVLADNGTDTPSRWASGSGLLIGGRQVLTSAHVVAGARTVYVRAIRSDRSGTPAKELWQATVTDAGDPAVADLALLEVSSEVGGSGTDSRGDLAPLRFARVDRRAHLPQVIKDCTAVGFPQFMAYAYTDSDGHAISIRETAQVSGEIPTLERLVSGLLTLRVSSSPQPLPPRAQLLHQSVWSGMSGAVVVVDDVVLGVVTEHFPRAGNSQLTITPITYIDRLEPSRRRIWEQALGIDLDRLPAYEAGLEPLHVLVRPGRKTAGVAAAAAVLVGVVAGVVAGRWDWGFAAAMMAMAAVASGSSGAKLLRTGSALENESRRPAGPPQDHSTMDSGDRTVNITTGRIEHSVIAAGDVHHVSHTNIKIGGFAALAATLALALVGVLGTAAISDPTEPAVDREPAAASPAGPAVVPDPRTGNDVWSCPPPAGPTSDHVFLLSEDTTYDQLTSELAGMQAHGGPVSDSATDLAKAVARLDPSPATSLEALTRLRFIGSDVDGMLSALNSEVVNACGDPEFTDDQLSYFQEEVRPQPAPGGARIGDVYGQCLARRELGWIAPFSRVVDCENGTVMVVDMTTGAVSRQTGLPDGSTTGLTLAGDKLVWATVSTQPAQGLSEETWQATLHVRDLRTGTETTAPADEGEGEPTEAYHIVLGGWPDRILLSTNQRFRMVDAAGNTLWTSNEYAHHGFYTPTASTLWIDPLLIDLNTGETIRDYGPADLNYGFESNGGCGNSAVLKYGGDDIWLTESPTGQPTVSPLDTEPGEVNILLATTEALVNMDSGGGLQGATLTGDLTWDIPSRVVTDFEVMGRWIVVTNPSGNKVLVDAATGEDLTSSRPDVADVLFLSGERLALVYSDPTNDLALVSGDADGGTVLRASWEALCG